MNAPDTWTPPTLRIAGEVTAEAIAELLGGLDDHGFADAWDRMEPEARELYPPGRSRYERWRKRHNGTDVQRWPAPLDLSALAVREPEAPESIAEGLHAGYAALLAGHGGVGKSAIALHLAPCIGLGLAWAGIECSPRRVLYLSCEDRENVLHWRLARICKHLGISMAELSGRLDILELVGHDCILWERDPRTGHTVTPAYAQLAARIDASQSEVLIVDGISDTFGGNENVRGDVKRYVNALLALVPPDRGAVLLLGHVAKPTAANAATSEGYSGSTAWHNAVRSRWYLYPETTQGNEDGRPERTGALRLELQKSNLGRADASITWRWNDEAHMFLPDAPASHFDRTLQQREEQRGILLALRNCASASITVPAAMQGPRTAYLVLSQRPEFPASLRGRHRAKSGRFRAHIETLRQSRQIEVCEIRRSNRHIAEAFNITAEGLRQCAQ